MEELFYYAAYSESKEHEVVKYLIENGQNNPQKLLEDKKCFSALVYLFNSVTFNTTENYKNFEYLDFCNLIGNFLYHLYQIKDNINFNSANFTIQNANSATHLNDRYLIALGYVLYLTNITAMRSVLFNKNFSKDSYGLNAHFLFISDKKFLEQHLDFEINIWNRNRCFFEFLCLNISSLSKFCDENRKKWTDLQSIDILLNIIKLKSTENIKFLAYSAISNIADDKQIESLPEINLIIENQTKYLIKLSQDYTNNTVTREKRQILENNKAILYDVAVCKSNNFTSSIFVVLQNLYNLSVNDKLKMEMYFNHKIKNYLKIILLKSNLIECKYTLRLLTQLSFNPKISLDLSKDDELIKFIDNLIVTHNNKAGTDHLDEYSLVNICKQIQWNIKSSIEAIENSNSKDKNLKDVIINLNNDTNKKHIMISYNGASRELCLKIKSSLETIGYKIWMDVNDIHGSSLDSMAKAVEQSYCVLMCVTEKYRQSINCQAEAQYAFKTNTPIIPLIMQQGCENLNGWVGIIMGDKIFVNFTKYDYNECMRRLKKEIDAFFEINNNLQESHPVSSLPVSSQIPKAQIVNKDSILKWDETKAKEWFEQNNLDMKIYNLFKPFTGIILVQLYEMKCEAPEFYYQSLNKENANLNSITLFSYHLKNLFTNN